MHRSFLLRRARGAAVGCTAALAALAALPSAARACSPVAWFTFAHAQPGAVGFVGRATPDTLLAGPGTMRGADHPDHFEPPGGGAIFGQVVTVERLASGASAELRAAIDAAGGRVVLVPWGHGADCSPMAWARSARWLDDDAHGLFRPMLRDREHWVDGIPTFDVGVPQFHPYPAAALRPASRRTAGLTPDSMLTADELLELLDHLPTSEALEERPGEALEPIRAWARAHPALATRYPAREQLAWLEHHVEMVRFRRREVALAGTYRVVVTTASGDSVVFHARTVARPTSPLPRIERRLPRIERRRAESGGSPVRWKVPAGMYVLTAVAASESGLPRGGRNPGDYEREGYLAIADSAETDVATGGTRQRGSLDLMEAAQRAVTSHPERMLLGTADRAIDQAMHRDDSFVPGWFTVHPDGRVTFELVAGPPDAPVRIRAERISTVTIDE